MTVNVERKVLVPAKPAIYQYTGRTTLEGGQEVELSLNSNVVGIALKTKGGPTQIVSVVEGSEGMLTKELDAVVRAFRKAVRDTLG